MSNFIIRVISPNGSAAIHAVDEISYMHNIISDNSDVMEAACSEFREYLNEDEPIKIGTLEYYRLGDVFRHIDYIAYNESLSDYVDSTVSDFIYESESSEKMIFENKLFGFTISVVKVAELLDGKSWVYGLRSEDIDSLTCHHVHADFSELMEALVTTEYSSLSEAFNEFVDDLYPHISIFGRVYHASHIIEGMDIELYNQQFEAWVLRGIKDRVIDITDNVATVIIPWCENHAVYKIHAEALGYE